jgi:hypothetical protein
MYTLFEKPATLPKPIRKHHIEITVDDSHKENPLRPKN